MIKNYKTLLIMCCSWGNTFPLRTTLFIGAANNNANWLLSVMQPPQSSKHVL